MTQAPLAAALSNRMRSNSDRRTRYEYNRFLSQDWAKSRSVVLSYQGETNSTPYFSMPMRRIASFTPRTSNNGRFIGSSDSPTWNRGVVVFLSSVHAETSVSKAMNLACRMLDSVCHRQPIAQACGARASGLLADYHDARLNDHNPRGVRARAGITESNRLAVRPIVPGRSLNIGWNSGAPSDPRVYCPKGPWCDRGPCP